MIVSESKVKLEMKKHLRTLDTSEEEEEEEGVEGRKRCDCTRELKLLRMKRRARE